MALKLSREYIEAHMTTPDRPRLLDADVDAAVTADDINDAILAAARDQLGDGEQESMTVMLEILPRDMGPLGGCITIKTPVLDWHIEYKGDKPGKG
ncbi:hypothetical protein [Agromyces subbeticus]|uniref:hypothetical protein n=1 Tax=Agromyces subbeticus TaxID=293890 RepID=UPI0003B5F26B|nr:hypothetical protein [Agromyces subbeticus]